MVGGNTHFFMKKLEEIFFTSLMLVMLFAAFVSFATVFVVISFIHHLFDRY